MAGSFSGTVVGKVAKDPERKAGGKAVGFSIPVSKGKDKPTTWVRVTCWGKTADFVEGYVRKGSVVSASGEIELREFDGKQGKQQSLEINAQTVTSLVQGEQSAAPAQAPAAKPQEEDIPW